jgi:hypothetical protein
MSFALPLLARAEDDIVRDSTGRITLSKIITSTPSSEEKLAACKRRIESGWQIPAIYVERYWLYNQDYYVVEDGNGGGDGPYRTLAAMQCGKRLIRACTYIEHWCKPNLYRVDPAKATLWRQVDGDLKLIQSELTIEQVQALKLLGVRTMNYSIRRPNHDTVRIS